MRKDGVFFKCPAQQIFPFVVGVHFFRRINGHHIGGEVQVAEGHPGLHGVDADAAVRAEHIVHVQFFYPFHGFFLEFLRGRGEIRIFITEQLIRDLSGQQDADVRRLVDRFAEQIHAHGGTDGGDVIGAERFDDFRQGFDHLLPGDEDFRVLAADIFCGFPGVFQVDGVGLHTDGKGADRFLKNRSGDGAHEGGIQAAA